EAGGVRRTREVLRARVSRLRGGEKFGRGLSIALREPQHEREVVARILVVRIAREDTTERLDRPVEVALRVSDDAQAVVRLGDAEEEEQSHESLRQTTASSGNGTSRDDSNHSRAFRGAGEVCDYRGSPRVGRGAARSSARFSSTVSVAVTARSTISSTAPCHFASAGASSSALRAAIAVSTGFTPMRAKWAAYAGIAAYRAPSSRSRSPAAAPRATRTYAKSRGGCRPAAAAPARTQSAERRACSGVSQLKSTPSPTSPATRHIWGPSAATTRRAASLGRSAATPSRTRLRAPGFALPTPRRRRSRGRPLARTPWTMLSGPRVWSGITPIPSSIPRVSVAASASETSPSVAPGWFTQKEGKPSPSPA